MSHGVFETECQNSTRASARRDGARDFRQQLRRQQGGDAAYSGTAGTPINDFLRAIPSDGDRAAALAVRNVTCGRIDGAAHNAARVLMCAATLRPRELRS